MIHDSQKLFRFRQLLVFTDGSVDCRELPTNLVSSVANRELNTTSFKKNFPFIPNLPRENSYCFLMSFPTMKFLELPRELLEIKFRITCFGFPFDFFV